MTYASDNTEDTVRITFGHFDVYELSLGLKFSFLIKGS